MVWIYDRASIGVEGILRYNKNTRVGISKYGTKAKTRWVILEGTHYPKKALDLSKEI